jgi:hypothetical protein
MSSCSPASNRILLNMGESHILSVMNVNYIKQKESLPYQGHDADSN